MPWENIKLNSGYEMPSIAFGTWKLGNGEVPISQIDQAITVGFSHIDTAQNYMNEREVGEAIRNSGLKRSEIFITTKFSGTNGLDIPSSIRNSLDYLGVSYVDLYLIHGPNLALPSIPVAWKEMEKLHAQGLAKSIGVSNFDVNDLEILMASATVPPAANQILLHPYYYATHAPIVDYAQKHNISIEAYSALTPLTGSRGGPVDGPVNAIAQRLDVAPEQVLLAWVKAKGAVAVTSSSKKDRLQRYLAAGDLFLTEQDINAIDSAGAIGLGFWGFHGSPRVMKTGAGILFLAACAMLAIIARRKKLVKTGPGVLISACFVILIVIGLIVNM